METAAEQAPWLGAEARSMRALERIVREAQRRCVRTAPEVFAAGVYGLQDR